MSNTLPPTDAIARMLNDLGKTADEVAEALKHEGVRGVRNSVRFLNPVVRYVRAEVRGVANADVIQADTLSVELADGTQHQVPLPQAVREFLDRFNRQGYPELELPEGAA